MQIHLAGYEINSPIWEGSHCALFRGVREGGGSVLIKIPLSGQPPPLVTTGLRRAFLLTRDGRLPGAVSSTSLEPYQQSVALVMEDNGGVALNQALAQSPPSLKIRLEYARAAAQALSLVHQNGIIHGDIKPANYIVTHAPLRVELTDFDSSILVTPEGVLASPERLRGTLAYISPEQTGRVNRVVDYRSDLYSLGITLFEIFTDSLPFAAETPLELISAHLSHDPPSPGDINPELPPILSQLILKLLRKDPSDRYQSARGVVDDLGQILQQATPTDFILGLSDCSPQFLIPPGLVGRDEELSLLSQFLRNPLAQGGSAFVSGVSGIGKSSLVLEASRSNQVQVRFVSGKFDQFERDVPYSALVSALDELCRILLMLPETALELWKASVRPELAYNARLIVDLVPRAEALLGSWPALGELRGEEARRRFDETVFRFLKAAASPERKLVLFLDDLQWADGQSLRLMQSLFVEYAIEHFALVGAYRSNEVDAAHPLTEFLGILRQRRCIHQELELRELNLSDLTRLLSRATRRPQEACISLANMVARKTAGNPFFVRQFLHALYRQGQLRLDSQLPHWVWDDASIEAQTVTDNVLPLIVARFHQLPPDCRSLLDLASSLGNRFSYCLLAELSSLPEELIVEALTLAVREEVLVLGSEGSPWFPLLPSAPESASVYFSFSHDRVQQAINGGISQQRLAEQHASAGRLLSRESSGDRLFEAVAHLNAGYDVLSLSEQIQTLGWDLLAARRAKKASAYLAARDYLDCALARVTSDLRVAHHQLAFDLALERAEVAAYLNDRQDMEARCLELMGLALTRLEKVRILEIRLYVHINAIQWQEVLEIGFEALELLGEKLPADPQQSDVMSELQALLLLMSGQKDSQILESPPMADEEKLAATRILKAISTAAYFSRPNSYPIVVFRIVDLSLRYGVCAESAAGFVGLAVVHAAILGQFQRALGLGELARGLMERFEAHHLAGYVAMVFYVFIYHWTHSLRSSLEPLRIGAGVALANGDTEFWSYCHYWHGAHSIFVGSNLEEVRSSVNRNYAAVHQKKQQKGLLLLHLRHLLNDLIGDAEHGVTPDEMSQNQLEEHWAKASDFNGLSYSRGYRAIGAFYLGRLSECQALVSSCAPFMAYLLGQSYLTNTIFYSALAQLRNPENGAEAEQVIEQFTLWAQASPDNYANKLTLLKAEKKLCDGDLGEAQKLFLIAIEQSERAGYAHEKALAHERLGSVYDSQGDQLAAHRHLQEAFQLYLRWGAKAVSRRLAGDYPQYTLRVSSPLSNLQSTIDAALDIMDLKVVTEAASHLAEVSDLPTLLGNFTTMLAQQSGSSRGLIFLPNQDGQLEISASWESYPSSGHNPRMIVDYVWRTGELVISNDTQEGLQFRTDPYFTNKEVRSILCAPISTQGKVSGVVYLENELLSRVFTPARAKVVQVLSAQAAISIEIARQLAKLELQHLEILDERERRHQQALKSHQLESHNQALASFLAIASHDLRAPLATIGLWTKGLRPGLSNERLERIREVLDLSLEESLGLIQSYLDAVAVEVGQRPRLNCESFDLADLIRKELDFHLVSQGMEIENTIQPRLRLVATPLNADPMRLGQVIRNFLQNTLHHGTGQVEVVLHPEGESAHLEVANQGPPIPPDVQARLFEAFRPGNVSRGQGLGLWICRVIIEAHGGQIGANYDSARGTVFWFKVPLSLESLGKELVQRGSSQA